ncbi:MAG: hypothetical protein KC505_06065 [Myxococcales bacterium]|nr:hypothetical protein [Myxococcales bacterium]USN50179.1 MAG: hypothetical protein H6731_07875 [Myxococcales bacterium]
MNLRLFLSCLLLVFSSVIVGSNSNNKKASLSFIAEKLKSEFELSQDFCKDFIDLNSQNELEADNFIKQTSDLLERELMYSEAFEVTRYKAGTITSENPNAVIILEGIPYWLYSIDAFSLKYYDAQGVLKNTFIEGNPEVITFKLTLWHYFHYHCNIL